MRLEREEVSVMTEKQELISNLKKLYHADTDEEVNLKVLMINYMKCVGKGDCANGSSRNE